MDQRALLAELQRLRGLVTTTPSFGAKAEALAWANRVLPLLQFQPAYHQVFDQALHQFHANLRMETTQNLWLMMLSQLDRAIHDLTYRVAGLIGDVESVKLPGGVYVAQSRIDELAALPAPRFDLTKLLTLLRELKDCQER